MLVILLSCIGAPDGTAPAANDDDSGLSPEAETAEEPWYEVECFRHESMLLDVFRHTSTDGITWGEPVHVREHTSVPDLASDPHLDGGAQQFYWMAFDDRSDRCNKLLHAPFDSSTNTVGEPSAVEFAEAPVIRMLDEGVRHPIADPEVIAVGDVPVMLVTLWPEELPYPCVGLFLGETRGSLESGRFEYLPHLVFCDPEEEESFTDAVAVWAPDDADDPESSGSIYVMVASASGMMNGGLENNIWRVTVPDPGDPSGWVDSGSEISALSSMHMLGTILRTGEASCPFRAWGTSNGTIRIACTADFKSWVDFGMVSGIVAGDPSVSRSAEGWDLFVMGNSDYSAEAP